MIAIFSVYQSFFITESLPITYQYQTLSDTTTPISLFSNQNGDEFIVSYCMFMNCSNSQSSGGAISSSISNGVIVSINETKFIDCFCDQSGGALFMQVTSGSEMHFESCSMNRCYSTQNGGGLFIIILPSNMETAVYLSNLYILNCSSEWHGGGICINTNNNTALYLTGEFIFDNCSSISNDFNGGGIYIEMTYPQQSIQMEGDYTFLNCLCNSYGGGMYLTTYQQVPIQINCTCMFQNCTSKSGGGMFISNIGSGDLTQLRGNFTFENCSAQLFGGGLFIESSNNGIIEIDDFIFIDCQSAHGGGIFWSLINDSKQFINGGQFINCTASIYGGGLYISFPSNSTLVLDKLCEFNKCVSQGCGGAIYANINYSLPFQFNISDTLIQQCTAKEDTTSTSPTGYGGGIFLTGSGDYDPSTENLDFRGMNINGNVAENGGQSLYVVMPNIIQWCKSGVAGEYIKGNYSDKYSDFEDIEGISADQITFNSLSLESVQQQQAPLQQYWVYISILTKVTATLNISDTNPLLINLEGYNMIEGQFTVKIVELGQISQMNKLNYRETSINNNQNKYLQIKIQDKHSNSILTVADKNSQNYNKINLISNYDFEIIYPPDDGSSEFIHIEGDPQSLQTASFQVNHFEWFDYGSKKYGVFISNDGRIFTGINGRQDEAYPLEVILVKLEISNITKAQATLNISDINYPLIINLEGYNMIPSQFTVKIIELKQTSQMNKSNQRQIPNNNNQNKQQYFKIQGKSSNPILPKSNTNTHQYNNNKINHIINYDLEIIYPPDDGSTEPILVKGDPQSQQTASFGMKDISWFDNDNMHYGIFVSNDRRIFTGIDGKQEEAYPLEIVIEKADIEQEQVDIEQVQGEIKQEQDIPNHHFPWWIILIIVLSSIILIIIILIIIIFFCWRKYKQEKNIEINYFTDMNYQNSRNLTEMNHIIEDTDNNHDIQNNQQDDKSLSNPQLTYSHLQFKKRFSEHNRNKQSKSDQSSSLRQIRHSSFIKPIAFNPSQNSNTTILESNSNSSQPENNQINKSIVHSSSGNLSCHSANTSSSKSLGHSLSTPLFQIHEPYPQYIDPPLHWEQQNQLQGSEKDFDPPLKKDPPIYPEVEQSHNISNEEQQTIIDWDSFKKINIPSFKYRNKKK